MAINKDFIIPDGGIQANGSVTISGGAANLLIGTISNTSTGFYASNSSIQVGNSSVNTTIVPGLATLTGNLSVSGTSNVNTLGVTGAANLFSTLGVTGAANLLSTLDVTGATTLSNTLSVTGATNTAALTASGLITGTAGATITGTASASVAVNVGANVNLSTSKVNVGNSTSNAIVSQTQIRVGTNSAYTNVSATEVRTTGALYVTGAATFSNNVTVAGNFTVSGTTTYVNTATLNVADNIITLNTDLAANVAPTQDAGIEVNRGNANNVSLYWDESVHRWTHKVEGGTEYVLHTKANDIALGTDTSGNYVATITAGNGLSGNATGEGSSPTISVNPQSGLSANSSGVYVKAGIATVANATGVHVIAGTDLTTNSSAVFHSSITRAANTTSNTTLTYGGTFSVIDSVVSSNTGHVTGVSVKTLTMPASDNTDTTYDLAAIANTANNQGIIRLDPSSGANDDVTFIGQGATTVSSNATAVYISSTDNNDNTTYDLATVANTVVNKGIIRLAAGGSGTGNDDISFIGQGATTVSSNATAVYISSTDNNTTYNLLGAASANNEGILRLDPSSGSDADVKFVGTGAATVSSNSTHVIIDASDTDTTYAFQSVTSANNAGILRVDPSSGANQDVTVTGTGGATVSSNATHIIINSTDNNDNTTYDLGYIANTSQGIIRLAAGGSGTGNDDISFIGLDEINMSSNATGVYIDHKDVARAANTTTGNTTLTYGGTFSVIDSVVSSNTGHITGVNVKTLTMPASDNTDTTYDLATVANTVANKGIIRLDPSSGANDDVYIVGAGGATVTSSTSQITITTSDNNTTYDLGYIANTTQGIIRLAAGGSGTGNDDVTFIGQGATTVSSNATAVYISSTDNNTTYDLAAIANTSQGIIRLAAGGSGTGNDDVYVVGSGTTNVSSNSTTIVVSSADQYLGTVTSITAGSGLSGNVTTSGTISVNAQSGLSANSSGVYVKAGDAIVSNATGVHVKAGIATVANATGVHVIAGTDLTTNSSAVFHNTVTRAANTTTGNTALTYGGTFSVIDSVVTSTTGHVTGVNIATHTLPASDNTNTTYDIKTQANTVANKGIVRLTAGGSGSGDDDIFLIGQGATTVSSNATAVYISSTDTTYDLAAVANTVANKGIIRLDPSSGANDDISFIGQGATTVSSNATAVYISSTDNNTTYDLAAVANTVANKGIIRLAAGGSGTGNDDVYVVGSGTTVVSSNSTTIVVSSADQYVGTVTTVTAGNGLSGNITSSGTIAVVGGTGVTSNSSGVHIGQDVGTTSGVTFANATFQDNATYGLLKLKANGVSSLSTANITFTANGAVYGAGRLQISTEATTSGQNSPDIRITTANTTAAGNVAGGIQIFPGASDNGQAASLYLSAGWQSNNSVGNTGGTAFLLGGDHFGLSGTTLTGGDINIRAGSITASSTNAIQKIPGNVIIDGGYSANTSGRISPSVKIATSYPHSNVVIGSTASGATILYANNTMGSSGQMLTSTGSVTYWSTPTTGTVTSITAGSGLSGNITSSGTIAVVGGTGITANSLGVHNDLFGGATKVSGKFYTGTTNPNNVTRINYDGNLYATNLYAITEVYAAASDDRLKTNVAPIESALDKVQGLTGFTFNWNETASKLAGMNTVRPQVGVSAQQVQQVVPEAVALAPFDIDENGKSKSGEDYLTVQYEKLVPLLIEAIKELKAEVAELKKDR